ncbi:arm repeat superfamily protein, partial [Trifolium pratense]
MVKSYMPSTLAPLMTSLSRDLMSILTSLSFDCTVTQEDNDYMPPDFLPLLQVIVSNIGIDENDSSILFQLLSSIMETGEEKVSVHIPHTIPSIVGSVSKWLTSNLEPWPQ